jgi:hypothetical protein
MTEMLLSGRLEETPLAEAAGELFRQKKTGMLTLTSGERNRQVIFYEGSPVAVVSADPNDHVGHFLTIKGKVSQEDGARIQALPETKEALQSVETLPRETLTWGLKFRFVNLAYDLFRWAEGTWAFQEGPPPRDIFLMKVPTPTLLTKGVRHMSPSLLMEKVPSDSVIGPGTLPREEAASLGKEEKSFLEHCREGRVVREILQEGAADPVRAREMLYVLISLGLVSTAPAPDEIAEQEGSFEEPAAVSPVPEVETSGAKEDSFEIERHTYGEPPAPTEEELTLAAPETLVPPDAPNELEPPGLEMPPDLEAALPPPQKESMLLDPGEGDGTSPETSGKIESPGIDMPPPPSPDLPPPPWQEAPEETGKGDSFMSEAAGGAQDAGMSPFSPPEAALERKKSARRPSAPGREPKPKSKPIIPSRMLLLLAAVGAAVVVGAGVWVGSQSFRSPSSPLPPIPPSEEKKTEMAEGLPVPAIPSSSTRGEAEPAGEPEAATPPTLAPEPPAAQEAKSPPDPAPEQAGSYEEGLAAFESGDYRGAASIWHDMLSKEPAAYSINVVVACQIDTVKSAFSTFGTERKVFTVPLELSDGRSCFRVCLGTFPGKAAAQSALGALPPMLQTDLSVRSVKSLL